MIINEFDIIDEVPNIEIEFQEVGIVHAFDDKGNVIQGRFVEYQPEYYVKDKDVIARLG